LTAMLRLVSSQRLITSPLKRSGTLKRLLVHQRSYALIPLSSCATPEARNEYTLYIKGFLGNSHARTNFKHWEAAHETLVSARGWGSTAYGWHWDSGQVQLSDAPVPWVTLGTIGAAAAKGLIWGSRAFRLTPAGLAAGMVIDGSMLLASKYWQATHNADNHSKKLASAIAELGALHTKPRVRIVAHSLGCKLLLNALKELPSDLRPHEVHLCGGAFPETIFKNAYLHGFAKEHTYVYFCTKDATLQYGYGGFHYGSEPAVGFAGLSFPFDNVSNIKVDHFFQDETLVHNQYGQFFHKFVGLKETELLEHERKTVTKHHDKDN